MKRLLLFPPSTALGGAKRASGPRRWTEPRMCVCVSPSKDSARLGRPQYGMLTQHQDREAPVARVRTERQEEGTLPAGERTDIYSYMEAGSQDAHVLMSCNLSK